jgi:hypothetical protein
MPQARRAADRHCVDFAKNVRRQLQHFLTATFLHQNLIFRVRPASSAAWPDFGFNSLKG